MCLNYHLGVLGATGNVQGERAVMLTGSLKSKVDKIWDTMWAGGIANPLSVIEQLTYLLFIKRLDELHTLREAKANRTKKPIEDPIFSPDQDHLRWSSVYRQGKWDKTA